MFNGVIFKTGKVKNITKKNSIYVEIQSNINLNKKDLDLQYVVTAAFNSWKIRGNKIFFYISNETIKHQFKTLRLNQIINLEKSLSFAKSISGHFIQGHVDTVAKIKNIKFIDKA